MQKQIEHRQIIDINQTYNDLLRANYKAYCFEANNENVRIDGDLRWKPSRLHQWLCDEVQKFIEADTGHAYDILLLSMPPQHGKSVTVTETLPSWYLGNHPEHSVIEVSYNSDYAKKFGRKNREKVKRLGAIFGVSVSNQTHSVTNWTLNNGIGSMISCGFDAGITGNPCNLMIIDDPIKNSKDAQSETFRKHLWSEWLASCYTRFAAGAKVIVIQTRWHEDDLYGKLKDDPNAIEINLPCEAEENDPLGRAVGEALCPEIGKDNKWLEDYKRGFLRGDYDEGGEAGLMAWNALFQGRPSAATGNLFKREWWQYYNYSDFVSGDLKFEEMVISVDAAFKNKEDNDFVCVQAWGKLGPNMYLVDEVKDHLGFVETCNAIMGMRNHYPQVSGIWVEDKANGSAAIEVMRYKVSGIIGIEPKGGKYARAAAVTNYIEAGNVFIPRDRFFVGDFVDSCADFPNGKHDDDVDAMSQCLSRLATHRKKYEKKQLDFYGQFEDRPKIVEVGETLQKGLEYGETIDYM